MEQPNPPENRNIDTGTGNYNERIEGDYIQGNVFQNIFNILGGQTTTPVGNPARPKNERILLAAVKNEVISRLKQSLHNAVLINLRKELQPQQVKRLWDAEIKVGQKPPEPIPETTKIVDVFDREEIAGKLLILGAPGSGKTTTQLELAQELIKRAEEQPEYPVPVLFNLSSWKDERQSMTDWLIAELKSKYGVSRILSSKMIQAQELLPLIDGLDEVKSELQESCVRAINQLLEGEYRPRFLIVCSRSEEYSSYETRFQLNGAICLHLLSNIQLCDYLNCIEKLYLWQFISDDHDILNLVRIPLMLNVLILARENIFITQWQQLKSTTSKRQKLLDIYINCMFSRYINSNVYIKKIPPAKKTRFWLIWLSQKMQKSDFLIEELQYFTIEYKIITYLQIIFLGIIFGLFFGFFSGITNGLFFGWFVEYQKIIRNSYLKNVHSIVFTIFTGIIFGFFNALYELIVIVILQKFDVNSFTSFTSTLLTSSFLYGILSEIFYNKRKLANIESMSFSFNLFKEKFIDGLLLLPVIMNFIFNWTTHLKFLILFIKIKQKSIIEYIFNVDLSRLDLKRLKSNKAFLLILIFLYIIPVYREPGWLIYGLFFAASWGLISALEGQELEVKLIPNQGTWSSAKNAIIIGIIYAIIFGILVGLWNFLTDYLYLLLQYKEEIELTQQLTAQRCSSNPSPWLLVFKNGFYGLIKKNLCSQININRLTFISIFYWMNYYGLVACLLGGGKTCIQHFIVRLVFYFKGYIPWNYARFLDYCTERLFLQRVGGRYRFIHKLLQDHFAQMEFRRD